MSETIAKQLQQRPKIAATLATFGALWATFQASRLANFTYLHFLRRSSLHRLHQHPINGDSFKQAWALVTGASDGIGRGFAEELCSQGFNVVLHGRNEQKLNDVKSDLLKQWPSVQIRIFVFDATLPVEQLEQRVAEDLQDLKNLRILVNNIAAAPRPFWVPLAENSAQRIGVSVDVDVRFTVEITRILLPRLVQQSSALVLTVGSLASEAPCPYVSVLSGTKAFGKAWSRSLNAEMKAEGKNVEVMHVLVGMVATPNEARTVSFAVPSPRTMARASLEKVGCGQDMVVGYWPHALHYFAITDLPAWICNRMFLSIAKAEREKEGRMTKVA